MVDVFNSLAVASLVPLIAAQLNAAQINDYDMGSAVDCSKESKSYNIPLRIGLLFVLILTSFIGKSQKHTRRVSTLEMYGLIPHTGVAGPIFLKPVLSPKFQPVFIVLKQFGTGVIVATAFVHVSLTFIGISTRQVFSHAVANRYCLLQLSTHAQLTFANECLGELTYEATASATIMAGLFFAFMVETVSHGVARKFLETAEHNDEVVAILVLEAGILFHSIRESLTLSKGSVCS